MRVDAVDPTRPSSSEAAIQTTMAGTVTECRSAAANSGRSASRVRMSYIGIQLDLRLSIHSMNRGIYLAAVPIRVLHSTSRRA